ncbi:hypothetical protein OIN60_08870 [Paenibacillus sp. P96]|uniref:Holin n=1 Tax=Paenibacillus zeirhizosphaerae TaxID=2987519 RepID=A0ABT9FR23_9BACL|nr:hypothetical protein [Paenibacillus sp. P96]MDP4096882.1 hypothetical protein [Paenibacillus sp. P96]
MDWKRKLASRKFWALLAGLVTAGLALFGYSSDSDVTVKIVGLIGAFGSTAIYMLSEAYVDGQAARSNSETKVDKTE